MSEQRTPEPSPPTRADRRLRPRRPARPSSKVVCQAGAFGVGRNLALAVLDVSEMGVRLRLKEALPPGREVTVGLTPPGQSRESRLTGRVVWCVAAADGTHLAGVRFDKQLDYPALQALGRLAAL